MTSEVLDCHYSIIGSGPAIFLTHGIGAAEDAWRFIVPKLSKNFTVITYDLRGHGKSPVTNKNFGLEDLVLDLERVREKANIDKGHFFGHSLGGMIAPAYAKKYPNKVLSVGMLSTVAGRSEDDSKKVWSVINEMEEKGIDKTLEKLIPRWFTDDIGKVGLVCHVGSDQRFTKRNCLQPHACRAIANHPNLGIFTVGFGGFARRGQRGGCGQGDVSILVGLITISNLGAVFRQ